MLTKRLEKLASVIPECDVLADVGCDHGYVGIEALKRGVARRVIFADLSDVCLNKARQNCPDDLKSRSSFVCQDGLGNLTADVAAICGMGGLEIISILNAAKSLPNTLVLQPMRNVVDVRKSIIGQYDIALDEKIFDGKFYDIIVAVKNGLGCSLTELELNFGRTNMASPLADFYDFLISEQTKLNNILAQCSAEDVAYRLALITRALDEIRRKL